MKNSKSNFNKKKKNQNQKIHFLVTSKDKYSFLDFFFFKKKKKREERDKV